MGRGYIVAGALALALGATSAHAQAQRVELNLPGTRGNDTHTGRVGWLDVTPKQMPAGGSFQVDTSVYAALDSLTIGKKWSEISLLVTTPATTTAYTMHNAQLTGIAIDAPDVTLTFSYGSLGTTSAKTPPGSFP